MKKIILFFLTVVIFGFSDPFYSQTAVLETLKHQTFERKYLIHLPPTYPENAPVPLVIFLHGGNGNYQTAQGFTQFNRVANDSGFVVVYPQAYYETRSNHYVWADGRGTQADWSGIDDVGFINKMIDSLVSKYKIDENRIYLCGFSNGSFLTQRIAFQANSKFAAMATLGGSIDSVLFATGNPNRSLPMMFVLGTSDPFIPYHGGKVAGSNTIPVVGIEQAVQFWVNNNNCKTSLDSINLPDIDTTDNSIVTVFEYTNCDCNAKVKFYKIVGGGHTWPGVELVLKEFMLGETNEDIWASQELWTFFYKHSLCSTTGVEKKFKPSYFKLYDNYPNPFNPSTKIRYSLAFDCQVELKVFDVLGNEIKCLLAKTQSKGSYEIGFEAKDFSSGIYFYRLRSGTFVKVKKMLRLK